MCAYLFISLAMRLRLWIAAISVSAFDLRRGRVIFSRCRRSRHAPAYTTFFRYFFFRPFMLRKPLQRSFLSLFLEITFLSSFFLFDFFWNPIQQETRRSTVNAVCIRRKRSDLAVATHRSTFLITIIMIAFAPDHHSKTLFTFHLFPSSASQRLLLKYHLKQR